MQAKIVMAVHERMITLAEDVLSEMTMPAEIVTILCQISQPYCY
jgi:seryl-tRNA synthetase